MEELRDNARIQTVVIKQKIQPKFVSKVSPRIFLDGDLVLNKPSYARTEDKLFLEPGT